MSRILTLLLALPCALHAAERPCPADGARYRLLPDPAYAVTLEAAAEPNAASNLQLRLHTPHRQHGFGFAVSNGYGVIHLLPLQAGDDLDTDTPPPTFHAFDAAMNAWNDPPQASGPAPEWLFIPELGPMLWYGLLPGTNSSASAQEMMPAGMFKHLPCTP